MIEEIITNRDYKGPFLGSSETSEDLKAAIRIQSSLPIFIVKESNCQNAIKRIWNDIF